MWCTREAEDVEKGPNLKYDPQWGWVHCTGGSWHTLGGTDLVGGEDDPGQAGGVGRGKGDPDLLGGKRGRLLIPIFKRRVLPTRLRDFFS